MCGDWGAQTLVATKSARFAAVLVAARLGTRAYFPTLGGAWTTRHPRVSVTVRSARMGNRNAPPA